MQMVIDRFGRMVLPKAIRNAFGLRPGDVLDAEETAESIILRPAGRADLLCKKNRVLVFGGGAEGDLSKTLADVREERLNGIGLMKKSRR